MSYSAGRPAAAVIRPGSREAVVLSGPRFAGWTSRPALVQRALVDLLRAGERSEDGHFAIARYRMEDRLHRVRAPALLIFGRRDPFGYIDKSRGLDFLGGA